jgi:hypothetical protein
MIRKNTKSDLIINLDGPDGNAFALMAYATRFAKSFGYASDEIDTMITRMKSGNYKNLVKTFDEYFDGYVILETKNEELL